MVIYGRSQEPPVVPLEHPVRFATRDYDQHKTRLRSLRPSNFRFGLNVAAQSVAFLLREHERFFVDVIYIHEKKAEGENRVQVRYRSLDAFCARPHM